MTTQAARKKWTIVLVLSLIGAVNYAARTATSAVLPLVRADLHISDLAIAATGTCFLWSYAVSAPFAGYLADRVRRSRVIIGTVLLWSAILALTALVRNVPELLVLRTLLGIIESAYLPAACALIGDYHSTATRATALGIHIAGLNLGVVGGGMTVGFLGEHFGWRMPFVCLSVLGAILAFIAWVSLGDPVLPPPARVAVSSKSSVTSVLRIRSASAVFVEGGIVAMSTWVFLNWLPLYFSEERDMSLAEAGFSGTFLVQMPSVIGILLGGALSDAVAGRRRERRMLFFSLALFAAAPFPCVFATPMSLTAVIVGLGAFSFLQALGQANESPLLCDLVGPHQRSMAFGILISVCNAAGGAAVLASGFFKYTLGFRGLFTLASIVLLCAAVVCLVAYLFWIKADLQEAGRVNQTELPAPASV